MMSPERLQELRKNVDDYGIEVGHLHNWLDECLDEIENLRTHNTALAIRIGMEGVAAVQDVADQIMRYERERDAAMAEVERLRAENERLQPEPGVTGYRLDDIRDTARYLIASTSFDKVKKKPTTVSAKTARKVAQACLAQQDEIDRLREHASGNHWPHCTENYNAKKDECDSYRRQLIDINTAIVGESSRDMDTPALVRTAVAERDAALARVREAQQLALQIKNLSHRGWENPKETRQLMEMINERARAILKGGAE